MARLSVQDENIAPRAASGKKMKQMTIFDSDDDALGGVDGDDDDGSDFEETVPKKRKAPAKAAAGPKKPRKAPAKKKETTTAKTAAALQAIDGNSIVVPDDDSNTSGTASPGTASDEAKTTKTASEQYQKLSQLEHVLKRPDTYVGSVEHTETKMWVFDQESQSMRYKDVTICPALLKIFDEILVNAADNKIRDPTMDVLNVDIDEANNIISVYNNGRGIPIEVHEKEKIYIPELIFGNLLTSSNYDDGEKKVTGGRNGYGAKLCNIFSTEFTVETADANVGKKYTQTWNNNMTKVGKPKIVNSKKSEQYTRITFKADLRLFGMEKLEGDILGVLKRRVYDLCGTVKDVKVSLNKQRLKIKNFKGYVEMFVKALQEQERINLNEGADADAANVSIGEDGDEIGRIIPLIPPTVPKPTVIHEIINDRWEVAFAISDGSSFNQVSFVNSIATTSGGTHVSYISDQIANKILDHVKKKNKNAPLRLAQIRNNMFVFVNCLIDNPAFTSQTKEQLTTKVSAFGSKCVVTEDFMKKVYKTSIVESVQDIATRNADKELKKQDGGKKKRITGYIKLQDANKAGTRESGKCTLVLTEGDSAMALAVAGLAVVGRDHYGVFPLRGKLLNVRDASLDQIMKNAEIQAIKQIMGLQHKKVYNTTDGLRYGHIMIMTDQDHDGSHIKGLIINFLDASFPGLLSIPGFLVEFITPIVKVSILRGKKVTRVIPFYTMPQYEEWRDTEGKTCIWKQKYYKGLGTSEPNTEGREYFQQLDKHLKTFHHLREDEKPLIELAFAKRNADARKDWLRALRPGTHLDPNLDIIPIGDFINKELILYSMADNIRSIPSVMDGFKPGQRKILYGCFKRNLVNEIKVAQLGGYVSENTGYHHGEQSLYQTIIGLAQDFVGSNNIYFLMPNGSFGSRASGGKDASAPRYIFTELNPLTRKIFHPQDDALYNYLEDDDSTVEPEWYAPIIPTILVNGAEGIGTGWSTNIPCYNPEDLVKNIRRMMNNEELEPMFPWYRGWTGSLEKTSADKFKVSGTIQQIDDTTIEITELPIKMWTLTMKEFLLDAIVKGRGEGGEGNKTNKEFIEDMTEEHGTGIKFVVTVSEQQMEKCLNEGLASKFKVQSSLSIANMVAFDCQGRLKKYESPEQILTEFYYVRLELYQKRKDYMSKQLQNQLEKLSNQARFIKLIIEKRLSVSNRRRAELVSQLEELKFPKFGKDGTPVFDFESDQEATQISIVLDEIENVIEDDEAAAVLADANKPSLANYDYLLGMAIWSLTRERYDKLLKQRDDKEEELTKLLKLSAKDLWNNDLDEFSAAWEQFYEDDKEKRESMIPEKKGKKKATRKRAVPAKKATTAPEEDFLPKGLSKGKAKATAPTKAKQTTIPVKPALDLSPPIMTSTPKKPIFGQGMGLFSSPIKKDEYVTNTEELVNSFTNTSKYEFGSPVASSSKMSTIFSLDDDDKDIEIGKPKPVSKPVKVNNIKVTKSKAPAKAPAKAKAPVKPTPSPTEISDDGDDLIAKPSRPSRRAATKKAVYQTIIDSEDEDSIVVDDDETSVLISEDEDDDEFA